MMDIQTQLRLWLKHELDKKGRGAPTKLAAHLRVRPDAITRILNPLSNGKEGRQIHAHEIPIMEEFFGSKAPLAHADSKSRQSLPVMGRIGAGAEILPEYEQLPPEGLFEIEPLVPVPQDAIAFEVEGDSMWPRYDAGDVIICLREGSSLEEVLGYEAAVRTSDGRRFLKRIIKGAETGTYDLESHNAAPIRNVRLEWVSIVEHVIRRGKWRALNNVQRKRALGRAAK